VSTPTVVPNGASAGIFRLLIEIVMNSPRMGPQSKGMAVSRT
jgi:hypothetical protein